MRHFVLLAVGFGRYRAVKSVGGIGGWNVVGVMIVVDAACRAA